MAVRRLADESVQPETFAFTAENLDWAKRDITKYPPGRQHSAIIPLLWRAQELSRWQLSRDFEYIARAAIPRRGGLYFFLCGTRLGGWSFVVPPTET
jgi:hypothetical protein